MRKTEFQAEQIKIGGPDAAYRKNPPKPWKFPKPVTEPWPFPKSDEEYPNWPYPNATRTKLSPAAPWPFPTERPKSIADPNTFPIGTHNWNPFPVLKEVDPDGKDLNSPGAKADAGKSRAWLCIAGFSNALERVAEVTTKGANKYTPNGWVDVDNASERYMDAAMRHLLARGRGEVFDKDLGTKHVANAIWNLLAVLELEERNERS